MVTEEHSLPGFPKAPRYCVHRPSPSTWPVTKAAWDVHRKLTENVKFAMCHLPNLDSFLHGFSNDDLFAVVLVFACCWISYVLRCPLVCFAFSICLGFARFLRSNGLVSCWRLVSLGCSHVVSDQIEMTIWIFAAYLCWQKGGLAERREWKKGASNWGEELPPCPPVNNSCTKLPVS